MLDVIKVSSSVVDLVEECVDFVCRFYYRSSKRRRGLKQIGDIIDHGPWSVLTWKKPLAREKKQQSAKDTSGI